MIQIGCAALYPITRYGFPYSLDQYLLALDEIKAAGFDACELEINVDLDLQEYIKRAGEVSDALARNELEISAVIGVVQNAFSLNKSAADRSQERFMRLCQLVKDLGCETVCICAYMPEEIEGVPGTEMYRGSPPLQIRVPQNFIWGNFWENAVDRFADMAQIAGSHGQLLIIENRVGDFISTSDGVLKLIHDAGQTNTGCLLDVAHTHAAKEHLAIVIPKLGQHLRYVHLADNNGDFSHHLPVGMGTIDFPAIFQSLKDIGYQGYVNVDFGGVPADKIWDEILRGRTYFEKVLEQGVDHV